MATPFPIFPTPLPPHPPEGYGWENRPFDELFSHTAFNTGINVRDIFLGDPRCIVCGIRGSFLFPLDHCHICPKSQPDTWKDLRDREWIPQQTKDNPALEPRNGMLMCKHHHKGFDRFRYFIRFYPELGKFVFLNFSRDPAYQCWHGKAIALDIKHHFAPIPSLFIWHEMQVRGSHPFLDPDPHAPDDIQWQDWITHDGVLNSDGGFNQLSPLLASISTVDFRAVGRHL